MATDLVLAKNTPLVVGLRFPGENKSLPLKAIVARRTEAVKGRKRDFPAGLGLVFMTENVVERAFHSEGSSRGPEGKSGEDADESRDASRS